MKYLDASLVILLLLLEYFNGHSPNGQFYKDRVEYIGLGTHFHF